MNTHFGRDERYLQPLASAADGASRPRGRARLRSLLLAACLGLSAASAAGPAAAAPAENMPIWRVQIGLVTCDEANADTDNTVQVSLNADNVTLLDHARDDFARGDNHSYDLNLSGVRQISDIDWLRIAKDGNDGWCIERFALYINGARIYSSGTVRVVLDNADGNTRVLSVRGQDLRASAAWRAYTDPTSLPLTFDHGALEHRVEGLVGDAIRGTGVYWGGRHGRQSVEITQVNATDLHVDVDLAYEVDVLPDPDVDMDFDLRFSCQGGVVSITPRNLNIVVGSAGIDQAVNQLYGSLEDRFGGALAPLTFPVPLCPSITIQDDGDVVFGL
jgi:hypothetical protein